jgi:hypothetical protein
MRRNCADRPTPENAFAAFARLDQESSRSRGLLVGASGEAGFADSLREGLRSEAAFASYRAGRREETQHSLAETRDEALAGR